MQTVEAAAAAEVARDDSADATTFRLDTSAGEFADCAAKLSLSTADVHVPPLLPLSLVRKSILLDLIGLPLPSRISLHAVSTGGRFNARRDAGDPELGTGESECANLNRH